MMGERGSDVPGASEGPIRDEARCDAAADGRASTRFQRGGRARAELPPERRCVRSRASRPCPRATARRHGDSRWQVDPTHTRSDAGCVAGVGIQTGWIETYVAAPKERALRLFRWKRIHSPLAELIRSGLASPRSIALLCSCV